MRNIIEKKLSVFLLTPIGIFSIVNADAQWQKKASGFPTPNRGLVELIAVRNNVAWGIASDAFNPIWEVAPVNDFTRTTDGGNHWTAGKYSEAWSVFLVKK